MGKAPRAGPPRRLSAFLLIAAGVVLLFHPLILGEGLLYFRDVSLNHFPHRIYATQRLLHGDFPLWNPYLSNGMPLAANPNELILHPITLLFLLLPVGAAFSASVVLQVLLAGWGMYLWGREEGLGQEAALFAAAGFALSGPLVSCGSLQNLLASWAWVPLALFAAARFRRSGSRWALLAYAGAVAVTLLAGDPVAAATAMLLAVMGALTETAGPGGRRGWIGPLAGAVLAAGLTLVALLPAREMVAVSERGRGLPLQQSLAWSIEPPRLLELAVPSLYGNPAALKPTSYWGGLVFEKGYPFLLSVYLGIVTLLFLIAVPWRGSRANMAMAGFAALCLAASLGSAGGIYPLLHRWMPLAASLRYPSRFLLPAALAVAFLSARGFEHCLAGWSAESKGARGMRAWQAAAWLAAAAALGMACVPGAAGWLARAVLGLEGKLPPASLEAIAATLRGSFLRCGVLCAGAAAAGWAADRGFLAPRRAAALLLAASAGDLLLAHHSLNPVVPSTFYEAHPPAADLVPRERIESRVYSEPRPQGFAVMAGSDDAWWGYYWDEISCRVATCLSWRIPLALDRSTDLLSAAAIGSLNDGIASLDVGSMKRLCEIASVGLIQTYRELSDASFTPSGLLSRQTNVPFRLYRFSEARPRAYWVGAALPASGEIVQDLTRPGWDPRGSVILEGTQAPAGAPGDEGQIEWLAEEPERLDLRVSAPRPGWVVVTDTYSPGWKAELDGAGVPILRANRLFRGVETPAGSHRLVLRYAPGSWRLGAAGSIVTLLAALVWAWRGRGLARA